MLFPNGFFHVQADFPSFAHHHIIIVRQERKLQRTGIDMLVGLRLLMFTAVC